MANGTRYEPSPTNQQARFAPGRQDRINAFRGVIAGLPHLDVTDGEKASALAAAAKALLTAATRRVAQEAAATHEDLRRGLKAAAQAAATPPAKVTPVTVGAPPKPTPAPEPGAGASLSP